MNFKNFQELLSIIKDFIDTISITCTFFVKIKEYIKKIPYKQITTNFC